MGSHGTGKIKRCNFRMSFHVLPTNAYLTETLEEELCLCNTKCDEGGGASLHSGGVEAAPLMLKRKKDLKGEFESMCSSMSAL